MKQTKYNVIIVKGSQSSVLEHKGRTAWCKRTAMMHCKDILELRTGVKDFDDVYIEEV